MLRVLHFQPLKELIKDGNIVLIVLFDISSSDHFHDHGEVLFIFRGLIMQIEHQRQQEHGRGLIPERVLALAALGRGVLKEVGHKALNVVVVSQIHEWVIAMAFLHVDEVNDLDVISLSFQ